METETIAVFIPFVMLIGSFYVLYTYISYRAKERMALIEKVENPEDLKLLFSKQKDPEPSLFRNAKWGILFISFGLALVSGFILKPYLGEEIIFGFVFLFPGLGLLIYYSIFKNLYPKNLKD